MPRKLLTIADPEIGRCRWIIEAAQHKGILVTGLDTEGERYYWGGPKWAQVHADALGVGLLEPPDTWLSDLEFEWVGRSIEIMTLADAQKIGSSFVKPPSSKDFPARVYSGGDDLGFHTQGIPPETLVLVSDIVHFATEYRLFICDRKVHTGSRYSTRGEYDPGTLLTNEATKVVSAIEDMLTDVGDTLPSAVVIDAGVLDGPGCRVAVIEANMAWFSQPYWSETDRVLDVVMRSAGPREYVSESDQRFIR